MFSLQIDRQPYKRDHVAGISPTRGAGACAAWPPTRWPRGSAPRMSQSRSCRWQSCRVEAPNRDAHARSADQQVRTAAHAVSKHGEITIYTPNFLNHFSYFNFKNVCLWWNTGFSSITKYRECHMPLTNCYFSESAVVFFAGPDGERFVCGVCRPSICARHTLTHGYVACASLIYCCDVAA